MTNERAIELLQRISDSQFDGIHGDERREALSMAVRALSSQQTDTDSQGLVNDCISRQAAIVVFENSGLDDDSKDTSVRVLEQLPSAQPQACDDAISRDDAIMAVKTGALSAATIFGRTDEGATAYYETVKAIKALPSAQPRKKGKWIDNDKINFPQCSECGMWIDVMQQSGEMNFCPHCGADMRGEEDENKS